MRFVVGMRRLPSLACLEPHGTIRLLRLLCGSNKALCPAILLFPNATRSGFLYERIYGVPPEEDGEGNNLWYGPEGTMTLS